MAKQRGGKLINIVGKGALAHSPFSSLQLAAKAWIGAFTAIARSEYGAQGIEIATYDPGICYSSATRNMVMITGEEKRAAAIRWLSRVLGVPAELPGSELAEMVLSDRKLPAERAHTRGLVMLSRAFMRLVLRQPAPFAVHNLVTRVIPAERSLLSN
jgi:short-subunit dehydrogenase